MAGSQNMRIGITGSTGGLGRRMVEILEEKGYQITCLVRKTSNIGFLTNKNIKVVYGDINDSITLKSFVETLDICIHLAAQVASETKETLNKVNVGGTKNICEALCRYNRKCRLIYCSSIVVKNFRFYKRPFCSAYTWSKYQAEKVVDEYGNRLRTTIIYPGYIYGCYDKNFLPQVIRMLKYGINFWVKGGEKNVPIVYVDDLCELFYLAIINNRSINKKYISLERNSIGIHDAIKFVAIKMGYQYPAKVYSKTLLVLYIKFRQVLSYLFKVPKSPLSIRVVNALSGRAKYFNNAKEDLGWQQRTSVYEGLTKAIQWYEENVQEG